MVEPESDADGQTIKNHRLTTENIRKMLAVDRVVLPLLVGQPDLFTSEDEGIDAAAAALERIPEISRALKEENFAAREFILTQCATVWAVRVEELMLSREITMAPGSAVAENLELLRNLPSELQPAATAWREMRLSQMRSARGADLRGAD